LVADLNDAVACVQRADLVGPPLLHARVWPGVVGGELGKDIGDGPFVELPEIDTRMPFSVSVPVLSAHTTSTAGEPSMAGNH